MCSQIFTVFLIGLVATHALPVPEETVSVMSDPIADIEAPENLEPKSIAQDGPVDLAPKAEVPESLEPKAVLPVDNSLEPVAEQMRSVISSANGAINDMAEEVKEAAVRALDYAKELTAPLNGAERANVPSSLAERALDVYGKMQADAKNLLDRTLQSTDSLQLSGRSIIPSFSDVVQIFQDKYLTPDGQELVKAFLPFGSI